jgi:hypothetical protein
VALDQCKRDLPSPGSPTISTSCPSPLHARSQRRISSDFLLATDEAREMALPSAASAAARADGTVQRHRFGHAFEFMAAALLDDEQASPSFSCATG